MFTYKFPILYVLTALVVTSGCVNPQQVELLERDQRRLRGDVGSIQSSIGTMQSDIDAVRTSLADTRANLQQMQRDISAIRERIDETRVQVGRQIGQTSRDGDQRVKTLESRLLKLEEDAKAQAEHLKNREAEIQQLKEAAQQTAQAGQAAQANAPDGYAEAALGESDGARRDFDSGWRLFERKDFRSAAGRFREFVKKYPKSRIAANAQYWLGECHYGLKEYDKAIVELDEVRRRSPQSEKVPAVLLRQGFAFAELGEKLHARLVLQDVVEKYSQSPEALKAKQKLKSLES
ncbi:MAG: tol-pal system protein YbgF [Candidatus Binatia bacterium]